MHSWKNHDLTSPCLTIWVSVVLFCCLTEDVIWNSPSYNRVTVFLVANIFASQIGPFSPTTSASLDFFLVISLKSYLGNFEPLVCMVAYNLLCKNDRHDVHGLPKPQDSQPYKKCKMYCMYIVLCIPKLSLHNTWYTFLKHKTFGFNSRHMPSIFQLFSIFYKST